MKASGVDTSQSYAYDADGNRTRDEKGTLVYNSRDQLVSWTRTSGSSVSYVLNGAGAVLGSTGSAGSDVVNTVDGDRLERSVSTPTGRRDGGRLILIRRVGPGLGGLILDPIPEQPDLTEGFTPSPPRNSILTNGHGDGGTGRNGDRQKSGDAGKGRLPRFDGPKPRYDVNPADVPGRGLRPRKTPLPADAEDVYRHAVPNDPTNPTAWFGKNDAGQIYRYSVDNAGGAHFSGIDGVGNGVRNLSPYARDGLAGG